MKSLGTEARGELLGTEARRELLGTEAREGIAWNGGDEGEILLLLNVKINTECCNLQINVLKQEGKSLISC